MTNGIAGSATPPIWGAPLTIVNEGLEKTYSDDIYNDGDGATDCEDSDCSKKKQCKLIFQTNYIYN